MGTYAALRLWIDSWRWEGVPFFVRAGKCLARTVAEVTVELRNPPQVVFEEAKPSIGNLFRFRLSPDVAISIAARAKKPGEAMVGQAVDLSVVDHADGTHLEPYERLLGDALAGDGSLFSRQDVVEAAWRIVDPVIHGDSELFDYEPGSWGPRQADRLVVGVGGWNMPP
jgi:glucose-6-phosphate 1-dehydrogenase